MRLLECLLVDNDCYRKYEGIMLQPEGIVVHSTDKAGTLLKRFVQPADGQTVGLREGERPVSAAEMQGILGVNANQNSWNRPGVSTCVHAFLGKTADGSYAACQTLPYTAPCWGSGSGPNGSYNGCLDGRAKPPLYIQFEMIEDSEGDPGHAKALYELAVAYAAQLCRLFPSIRLENVISHKEVCDRGCSGNRSDPESYWQRCGLPFTMDGFREALKARLGDCPFTDVPGDAWYRNAVVWAWQNGITAGTDPTHFSPYSACTRAETVQMLYRLNGLWQGSGEMKNHK